MSPLPVAPAPGPAAPAAEVRRALSVDGLSPARAASPGPLAVVFGAPSGETTAASEVTLVFNKPMRKLGLSPHDPPAPVRLRPPAPGSWDWVGTSALRFTAATPLPGATAFQVEVPAGTRALDNSPLEQAYALAFSTPRPALATSSPEAGEESVPPARRIELSFNQPVSEAEVQRAVSLVARGGGAPLLFSVGRDPKSADRRQIQLTPRAPLPRGATLSVRIDASLHGEEGPLPAGKAAEITFRTIDPPRLIEIACEKIEGDPGACSSLRPLTLRFNNGLSPEALWSALSVEPKVKLTRDPWPWDSTWPTNELELQGDFEPGKTYRVRVHPGAATKPILDAFDQPLTGDARQTIRFGDLRPEVEFVGSGVYWAPEGRLELPVSVTNVTDVEVTASPRTREQVVAALEGRKADSAKLRGKRLALPNPAKNRPARSTVRLEDLLPIRDPRGPILLQATYREGGAARATERELQVTDLGIGAKLGREAAVLWVTRLSTGAPLDKAEVAIHRVTAGAASAPPPVTAVTDATGAATLPLSGLLKDRAADAKVAVFVRSGDDWAYQVLSVPAAPAAVGSIFTERGLYRPSEEVSIKGIFRVPAASGLTTPAGRTISVQVWNAKDEPFATWTAPLSAFGTMDHVLPLPRGASVGNYRIEAELEGATVRGWFEVAEYRPTEIAVEVNADRAAYVRGDTLACAVQGRYLHGGAMVGSTASVGVSRREATFVPPGLAGFVVGDPTFRSFRGHVAGGDGVLDDKGRYRFTTLLDLAGQQGPETVSCNVEVADLNRQTLTTSTTALVHPGEAYLGLVSPAAPTVRPGARLLPGVLAVDPQGTPKKLAVRIELGKRTLESRPHEEEREVESVLGACSVTTGLTPVTCPLTVPGEPFGQRETLFVRATAQDRRGNPLASLYRLWPAERARTSATPRPPGARPEALQIELDRQDYEVGQTAELRIQSPFPQPATAWITVERESVLWSQKLALTGPEATVAVPITEALIPNAQVSVSLIHGSASQRSSTWLEVDPAPRRLAVAIRPSAAQVAPGDSVDLDVAVTDARGAPARAEVTLFAADEGTLSLIRYRTPDPLGSVFRRRPIRTLASDAREDLFLPGRYRHRAEEPQVRMGATGVSTPRVDFRQTVLFAPRLVTDASGHVRHRVKLPDGLTTYRFMAVAAAEDDRFGSAEAHVTASQPLMARATLPRVIRAGDRFEASVVIATRDLPAADVEITASVTGLSALAPPRRSLRLEPGIPVEVRYPMRADRAGPARVTFQAAARSAAGAVLARDAVALSGQVVTPLVLEAVALSGDTRGAVAEALGDLSTIRDDTGGLELRLASTPLAGLASGIRQLIEYPYGCTEQTVSRMLPLLSLRDLSRALGEKLPDDVDGALRAAVQKVAGNQRADGGFGLWPTSTESEPWVTAYALFGLQEAARHGAPVKAATRDPALGYLRHALDAIAPEGRDASAQRRPPSDEDLAAAAFTVDVLADGGAKDTARMAFLFRERSRLPLFGKALLLHAFAVSAAEEGAIAELRREVEASIRIDGPVARAVAAAAQAYAPLLDSETRTSAMALRALLAVDKAHPLAARLALGLLADRRGGVWRSTQEAAWALLALDAFRRAQPEAKADFDARVFLGGSLLTEASFRGANAPPSVALTLPISRLEGGTGQPLTFAVSGAGELHYEARLRFARKALPTEPQDGGFFVEKTMQAVDAASGLGPSKGPSRVRGVGLFHPGDLIVCEVKVVTPTPRHYVVVDDPLPGGFEAVDSSLRKGGDELAGLEGSFASRREIRDDRVLHFIDHLPAGLFRYRYLARATTLGTFVLPPTRVEEMYVPETFGTTAASVVQIGGR